MKIHKYYKTRFKTRSKICTLESYTYIYILVHITQLYMYILYFISCLIINSTKSCNRYLNKYGK